MIPLGWPVMNKDTKILVQDEIHDLCLTVRLWVIGSAHPKLGSIEAKKLLQNLLINNESRSEPRLRGKQWCLQTMSRNKRTVL